MNNNRSLSQSISYVLATGALSGKSPILPGTMGTIAALALAFLLRQSSPWASSVFGSLFLALIVSALGIVVIQILYKAGEYGDESKDPQEIVIDEFAGFFLTIVVAGPNPMDLLYCFLLFRLFDMTKPPPIKRIEKAPGAWGIMLDDLAAGIYAMISFVALQQVL